MAVKKRLNAKEKYRCMTRDLDWEPSYQSHEDIYPHERFEGIKITDWDKWEDPFRLTMDSYWKYQAEKEKKLYAIFDAFSQNNGHTTLSDARYVNALKLFLSGITPLEYQAYQGFARVGRQFSGAGARIACQMQAIDELRHVQTQIHAMSHYNKHFNGLHDFSHMHDRLWFLSVPKSFFEDARTAGPFEFLTAISFSFEYVLTNLLFVPFMSGAAFNGDMATVTFGFSAQSDEARHMTLGLEVIKFLLEQHEDNVPIIQRWIDKWFWRGYRLLTLVGMMMDYMLPNKVMSWSEAWSVYFEDAGGALFKDLERYGIRPPKHVEEAKIGKDHVSHQAWSIFYQYSQATNFHTWIPLTKSLTGCHPNIPTLLTRSIARASSTGANSKRRANASTTRPCRCSARSARSRCRSASRMTRPPLAIAPPSTRVSVITFALRAAATSSNTSRPSTSRPGYRCTRSCRAIAVARMSSRWYATTTTSIQARTTANTSGPQNIDAGRTGTLTTATVCRPPRWTRTC
jgi:hypothetical protein